MTATPTDVLVMRRRVILTDDTGNLIATPYPVVINETDPNTYIAYAGSTGFTPITLAVPAGGSKVASALYLPSTASGKNLYLKRVAIEIISNSAAARLHARLLTSTVEPSGGTITVGVLQNPGTTPVSQGRWQEAPTSAVTIVGQINGHLSTVGVTGAGSAANPPPFPQELVLFEDKLTMPPPKVTINGRGWQVLVSATVATTVVCAVNWLWTEAAI